MSKEIVVNAEEHQTRIAIVEDGDLVELYIENPEHKRTIGNIMLGRVRKVMPSIRAAFVDIGQDSDAFLHFSDVSDNLSSILDFLSATPPKVESVTLPEPEPPARKGRKGKRRRPKGSKKSAQSDDADGDGTSGKRRSRADAKKRKGRRSAQKRFAKKGGKPPQELLKRGQTLLVKIAKEPISNKGSRISTDISLAGRFLVLVPLSDFVAVSKKITSHKERRRLRALAKSLVPDGFGIIVRTVAEGRDAKALDTDLKLLLERWRRIEKKLKDKPRAPLLLHEDVDMISSIIRDLFSSDYDRILIDDRRLHRNIRSYVQAVAPQMASNVKLHTGKQPVFEKVGIRTGVERAFERRVELPGGGYLFIERTEAMHVIDVNSGRSGKGMSQEQNSLKVNLEAARVAARQIRLRDLGGIIVVDFIDLRHGKNRQKIYDALKKEFAKDRAVTKVLPMSDFGLVQITRQRLRPSITTTFSSANGTSEDEPAAPEKKEQPPPGEVKRLKQQVRRLEDKAAHPDEEMKRLKNKVRRMRDAVQAAQDEAASARRKAQEATAKDADQADQNVPPPEEVIGAIEQWIAAYKSNGGRGAITLRVHPFTAAFLNRNLPSYPTRWFMRHLIRVRVEPEPVLSPLVFRFFDARSGEDLTERYSASQDGSERAAAAS